MSAPKAEVSEGDRCSRGNWPLAAIKCSETKCRRAVNSRSGINTASGSIRPLPLDRQKRLSLTYETYISRLCNSARGEGAHVDSRSCEQACLGQQTRRREQKRRWQAGKTHNYRNP